MAKRIDLPIAEVEPLYLSGATCHEIAERYGVSTTVVLRSLRDAGVAIRRAGARSLQLVGQRFGRLIVERREGHRGLNVTWRCRCSCGNTSIVTSGKLREGNTKSCGCLAREQTKAANTRHGHAKDYRRSREYKSWESAKGRCYRKRDPGFKNYGGRGIKMCDRWRESFEAFLEDMGPCPPGYSIERIDVNGNYSPSNARWASTIEQHNNRRDNRYVEVEGERMTVAQASRRLGIPAHRLYSRSAPSQM